MPNSGRSWMDLFVMLEVGMVSDVG